MVNNKTSSLQVYSSNENKYINILKATTYTENQAFTILENQMPPMNTSQAFLSTSAKPRAIINGRNTRLRNIEVPFNVSGWPVGTSLSVEDYVNYFRSTSTLLPDTSRDSSTFDEDNNISVLIGIGRKNYY